MTIANHLSYLADTVDVLKRQWPENRTVNIVCHGHSVPAGYFATPVVDSFNAYPHLLHVGLKKRFPSSVLNVIVTAIGGEESESGAKRFEKDVLCHQPDVVTIDYGLNDRRIGLEKARTSWEKMIKICLAKEIKVILMTPTLDLTQLPTCGKDEKKPFMVIHGEPLAEHAEQIRCLASKHELGLADNFAVFHEYLKSGELSDLLSSSNHPNRRGHELVAKELLRWFEAV